jgi:hypothetical protein
LLLPSVRLGFFSDDHALLFALDQPPPTGAPPWWDLYHFTPDDDRGVRELIGAGLFPWWTVSSLRLHLVRPLSSALLAFDHRIFGDSALGYHLHSLAWFVALLAVAGALFRRVLPRETATLALVVFALADANVAPAAWIAARHTLVAAVPALLALLAFVRARQDGWAPGRWLAPLGMSVGLLGGEAALGGLALALSYDLFGPANGDDASLRSRAVRALPMATLAVAYLAVYAAAGGGAHGSGAYLSPLDSPVAFAQAALTRFPVLVADAFLGVPAELSVAGFARQVVVVGLGTASGVALLWRACAPLATDEERAVVRWVVPGAAAALLASLGAFPGARLLLVPNVGVAILVATILRRGFGSGPYALARRAGAGILALTSVLLAPPLALFNQLALHRLARTTERLALDAEREVGGAQRVFVVAASDPMVAVYPRFVLLHEGATSIGCWAWLDGGKADARVTRLGPDSIAVEPIGAALVRGAFEQLYRAPSLPTHEGDEVVTCGARVRVASVADGFPTRIEVRFGTALEDAAAGVALLAWQGGALRRLAPPAIGESFVLPWTMGPSGLF